MFKTAHIIGSGILLAFLLVACEQTPSYIISPPQMEDLLVDIHKAEAISDNITKYASEGEKERLRQSVFRRHHVTQAQFDTSLVWYSDHMTKYSQIYTNVTSRIREEDEAVKNLLVERKTTPLTPPGDSVNIWNKASYFLFEPRLYRHVLSFNISADDNFRENDLFQFSVDLEGLPKDSPDKARITLVIQHRNDSVYSVVREVSQDGIATIEAQAQNERVSRIIGSIEVPLHPMWQESYARNISLLRIRYKKRPNLPQANS
ncbi:MAG: DUF4296 domain-containing protein [Porphyromonadaceae bacterium]|nr:DUF4296 domain-containing protein [Porphyromonadaceae bacterium]